MYFQNKFIAVTCSKLTKNEMKIICNYGYIAKINLLIKKKMLNLNI